MLALLAAVSTINLASTGNEVLMRSAETNIYFSNDGISGNEQGEAMASYRRRLQRSLGYTRNCYRGQLLEVSDSCKQLWKPMLPSTIKFSADCPFVNREMCRNSSAGVIRIESGLLNSDIQLGINAPEGDRVDYLRTATCTPLPLYEAPRWAEEWAENISIQENRSWTHIQLKFTNDSKREHFIYNTSTGLLEITEGYRLQYVFARDPGCCSNQFSRSFSSLANASAPSYVVPIKDLQLQRADILLLMLSNTVDYLKPSNDLIFGTRRSISNESCQCNLFSNNETFLAQPVVPFVCTTEHRFRNPTNDRYTEPGGLWNLLRINNNVNTEVELMLDIGLNERQIATASLIAYAIQQGTLKDVIDYLGVRSMVAYDKIMQSDRPTSLHLENNQTAIEVENWFNIQLAFLQLFFYERVHSEKVKVDLSVRAVEAKNEAERVLFHAQRARDQEYVSFSVFGLGMTILLGLLIIVLSLTIEPLVRCMHGRRKKMSHAQIEWQSGELLQMQSTSNSLLINDRTNILQESHMRPRVRVHGAAPMIWFQSL